VYRYGDKYEVARLDVGNGVYTKLYDIPLSRTTPAMNFINACDISPKDGILYCFIQLNGATRYLARIDQDHIAYVAQVSTYAYTGAFDGEGNFFFIGHIPSTYIGKVIGPHTFMGSSEINNHGLVNLGDCGTTHCVKISLDSAQTGGVPADFTTFEGDIENTGRSSRYLIGIHGTGGLILKYESDGVADFKIWRLSTNQGTDVHAAGACWTYQNVPICALNNGGGVYELDVRGEMTITAGTGSAYDSARIDMRRVGSSDANGNNDGANCKNVRSPFATCGNKNGPADPVPHPVSGSDCGDGSSSLAKHYRPSSWDTICGTTPCDVSTPGVGDHLLCCTPSTTPPVITGYNPLQAATDVDPSTNIRLTFSEAVQAGIGHIELYFFPQDKLSISVRDTSQVSFSGSVMTVNPRNDLNSQGMLYTVIISGQGVIQDSDKNYFTGLGGIGYQFTTMDIQEPTLVSYGPVQGATEQAIDTNIVLTFDEAIQAGTGVIVLTTTSRRTATTIAVSDSKVSFSGRVMTINPGSNLPYGSTCGVTMADGVVTDQAASPNPSAGLQTPADATMRRRSTSTRRRRVASNEGVYEFSTAGNLAAVVPTASPTAPPTATPTMAPTPSPTFDTGTPITDTPTAAPTHSPLPPGTPTAAPTSSPTKAPTSPTAAPSSYPTKAPTTRRPTSTPTASPTYAPLPPGTPTAAPTLAPVPPGETRPPTMPPADNAGEQEGGVLDIMDENNRVYFIIVASAAVCCCCLIICCCCRRRDEDDEEENPKEGGLASLDELKDSAEVTNSVELKDSVTVEMEAIRGSAGIAGLAPGVSAPPPLPPPVAQEVAKTTTSTRSDTRSSGPPIQAMVVDMVAMDEPDGLFDEDAGDEI